MKFFRNYIYYRNLLTHNNSLLIFFAHSVEQALHYIICSQQTDLQKVDRLVVDDKHCTRSTSIRTIVINSLAVYMQNVFLLKACYS